jgi:hypothetical protein
MSRHETGQAGSHDDDVEIHVPSLKVVRSHLPSDDRPYRAGPVTPPARSSFGVRRGW